MHLWISSAVFFAHLIFASKIWSFKPDGSSLQMLFVPHHFGLFANTFAAAAYLVWAVAGYQSKSLPYPKIEKIGKPLGNIAYAIFLTHWIAAIIVVNLGIDAENKLVFLPLSLILLHLISISLSELCNVQ